MGGKILKLLALVCFLGYCIFRRLHWRSKIVVLPAQPDVPFSIYDDHPTLADAKLTGIETNFTFSKSESNHESLRQRIGDVAAIVDQPSSAPGRTIQRFALSTFPMVNPGTHEAEMLRRECIQEALRKAIAFHQHPQLMNRKGCNYPVILDFERWAESTNCGRMATGTIIIHAAWMGPWVVQFGSDIESLLDSFLITQDLNRSRFIFWFVGEFIPKEANSMITKYERYKGVIEFRNADVLAMARGTCLEGIPQMWNPPGPIPQQTKSDVFRLLVLHLYGGVWVDTDTILLRDIRPVVEYGGEFGGLFAMTLKYNNAFISLRQNSTLSRHLLNFACDHPKVSGKSNFAKLCRSTGSPCHPEWWYNHGPQQWAFRSKRGLIVMPLALFDPANDCYGKGLLSGSGAYRMGGWKLSELLELYRGAYALHTRSYQVAQKDRPLRNDTQFSTLFNHIRQLSVRNARNMHLAPVGVRNESVRLQWRALTNRARKYTPPDPAFVPGSTQHRVVLSQELQIQGEKHLVYICLAVLKSNGYAKATRLSHVAKSDQCVWIWHSDEKYLRPATLSITQIYCMDSQPIRNIPGRPETPDFNHCDHRRQSQKWHVMTADGKTLTPSPNTPVSKVTIQESGSDRRCLEVDTIIDERFCGFDTMVVKEMKNKSSHKERCLGAILTPCSKSGQWIVSTPDFQNSGLRIENTEVHEMLLPGLPLGDAAA